MSQDILNVAKLNLSNISNESETKSSSVGCPTPTAKPKPDMCKQTKTTARKVNVRKTTTDKLVNKSAPRRRSLTMTDIRNKAPQSARTPMKQIKQDSCSTTDYSPRSSNEHPAEKMLTIRCRELQIRTFSKMFHSLWRKQKNMAENFKDEVSQLQLQKSFLMNLRDKESERREEITKVADKQKTEIIDLSTQLELVTKERDKLEDLCKKLQNEYYGSIEFIKNTATVFANVHEENQNIIYKVKEVNDLMDARFIGLKTTMRCVEDVSSKVQQNVEALQTLKQERNKANKTKEKYSILIITLEEKLKNKEETEKNLKDTINELRKLLEKATTKNLDLKSEVKNMELQLEFVEHQLNEKNIRFNPWSEIARKAARLSMYILYQFGFLPVF